MSGLLLKLQFSSSHLQHSVWVLRRKKKHIFTIHKLSLIRPGLLTQMAYCWHVRERESQRERERETILILGIHYSLEESAEYFVETRCSLNTHCTMASYFPQCTALSLSVSLGLSLSLPISLSKRAKWAQGCSPGWNSRPKHSCLLHLPPPTSGATHYLSPGYNHTQWGLWFGCTEVYVCVCVCLFMGMTTRYECVY